MFSLADSWAQCPLVSFRPSDYWRPTLPILSFHVDVKHSSWYNMSSSQYLLGLPRLFLPSIDPNRTDFISLPSCIRHVGLGLLLPITECSHVHLYLVAVVFVRAGTFSGTRLLKWTGCRFPRSLRTRTVHSLSTPRCRTTSPSSRGTDRHRHPAHTLKLTANHPRFLPVVQSAPTA